VADRSWWGIRYSLALPASNGMTPDEYDVLIDRLWREAKYG